MRCNRQQPRVHDVRVRVSVCVSIWTCARASEYVWSVRGDDERECLGTLNLRNLLKNRAFRRASVPAVRTLQLYALWILLSRAATREPASRPAPPRRAARSAGRGRPCRPSLTPSHLHRPVRGSARPQRSGSALTLTTTLPLAWPVSRYSKASTAASSPSK